MGDHGIEPLEEMLNRLVRAGLLLMRDAEGEPTYQLPPKFLGRNWEELALGELTRDEDEA